MNWFQISVLRRDLLSQTCLCDCFNSDNAVCGRGLRVAFILFEREKLLTSTIKKRIKYVLKSVFLFVLAFRFIFCNWEEHACLSNGVKSGSSGIPWWPRSGSHSTEGSHLSSPLLSLSLHLVLRDLLCHSRELPELQNWVCKSTGNAKTRCVHSGLLYQPAQAMSVQNSMTTKGPT